MSFIPQPCATCDTLGSCACVADAVVYSVPASVTTVTVAPMNLNRKGLILWNDSTATSYIKFGVGASNTDFTWKIGSQSGYELPNPIYQGDVTAVWDAANGSMRVTELV